MSKEDVLKVANISNYTTKKGMIPSEYEILYLSYFKETFSVPL